jgi:hypothetical protein
METFVALLVGVAVVSAIRGVWSPCGLSMLSSITPMTEAGRGNRFGLTASWFALGGLLGGLSLGLVSAGAAAGVAALDLELSTRLAVAALVAAITSSMDLGLVGIELPVFKRQVNDGWLRTYRSWVYGAGFGWQIGFGVATYIMTAGVFLVIGLAVLSASPAVAVLGGATFGLVRGLAVFVGAPATTPAKLASVHERLDRAAPTSRAAAAAVQVVAAGVLAARAWSVPAGLVLAVALVASRAIHRQGPVTRGRTATASS